MIDLAARPVAFVGWTRTHIRGDGRSEAQIFLDRFFEAPDRIGGCTVAGAVVGNTKPARSGLPLQRSEKWRADGNHTERPSVWHGTITKGPK